MRWRDVGVDMIKYNIIKRKLQKKTVSYIIT